MRRVSLALFSLFTAAAALAQAQTDAGAAGVTIDPLTGAVTFPSISVFGAETITPTNDATACLTVSDANSPVAVAPCNGSAQQVWIPSGASLVALGKCLDVGTPTADKTLPLVLQSCAAGKPSQTWSNTLQAGKAGSQFQVASSGLCLAAADKNGPATLTPCAAEEAELWTPRSTSPNDFACTAQVSSNGIWSEGGSTLGALTIAVTNTGTAPLSVPYTVQISKDEYRAPTQLWNMTLNAFSDHTLMGTLNAPWQTLAPGGNASFGFVLPIGDAATPPTVVVNGTVCTLRE